MRMELAEIEEKLVAARTKLDNCTDDSKYEVLAKKVDDLEAKQNQCLSILQTLAKQPQR